MMEDEGMSLHSGSAFPPLFTIEQIELIRRLRNTGITKEEVIYAFDSLDRLDSEFGVLSKMPPVTTSHAFHKDRTPQKKVIMSKPNLCQTPPVSTQNEGHVIQSCDSNGFDLMDENCSNLSNSSSNDFSALGSTPIRHPGNQVNSAHSLNSVNPVHSVNSVNPVHSVNSMGDRDYSEELSEFIKKGADIICEEIRGFVRQHQITQTHIAMHSGISQSYVSRYLRGDYCDMSESSCRGIYLWYLNARKKTFIKSDSITFTSIQGTNPGDVIADRQNELSTLTSSQDTYLPHRRERFTFRPSHLQILESYFSQNQYPTGETREAISTACNEAFSSINLGHPLTDREKVYPHIVANWFANRRKELKKITKESGSESSQNYSTGTRRLSSTSMDSNLTPLADDKQLTLDQLDSQSLSMAVEVAAVNQAILSLTG